VEGALVADLETILTYFEGRLEPRGIYHMVRCPAHDDHIPSLSIWKSPNGWVNFHCFAGCPTRDILAAVGLKRWQCGPLLEGEKEMARTPIAWYEYTDEREKVLYEVLRYDNGSFMQRVPKVENPDRHNEKHWTWCLGAEVRRVLYRLPRLLRHPDWPVVVVEGEKKVHMVEALGLPVVATCNHGGAGRWRPAHSQLLLGRRVTVIPDMDEPGVRHAKAVLGCLQWHGVWRTRVVPLPGISVRESHGFGLDDWLQSGKTRDDFVAMIRSTDEWGALCHAARS